MKVVERVGNHLEEVWRPVSEGAVIDYFDCEVYQVAAAYMMQVHTLPARAVIDARRQEIQERRRPGGAAGAGSRGGAEVGGRVRDGPASSHDGWTPTPFKL